MQRIEDFFSKEVTHFITLHEPDANDKENKEKGEKALPDGLGSPIKLRARCVLLTVVVVPSTYATSKITAAESARI